MTSIHSHIHRQPYVPVQKIAEPITAAATINDNQAKTPITRVTAATAVPLTAKPNLSATLVSALVQSQTITTPAQLDQPAATETAKTPIGRSPIQQYIKAADTADSPTGLIRGGSPDPIDRDPNRGLRSGDDL